MLPAAFSFQVMGEIAEMDIAMWEAGGRPYGSYEKPPRGAARGRWQRGFDYGGIRAHKYLVEKFLMNMVGMTFEDALSTLRTYCAERGFEPPGKKKPYAHMARFIQSEFSAFRAWLIARGSYSRGG